MAAMCSERIVGGQCKHLLVQVDVLGRHEDALNDAKTCDLGRKFVAVPEKRARLVAP